MVTFFAKGNGYVLSKVPHLPNSGRIFSHDFVDHTSLGSNKLQESLQTINRLEILRHFTVRKRLLSKSLTSIFAWS